MHRVPNLPKSRKIVTMGLQQRVEKRFSGSLAGKRSSKMTGTPACKMVTYVPKGWLDAVIQAICAVTPNTIGNYINCMSWWEVTSTWTPVDGANPFIGTVGEMSVEPEYRLEFLCDADKVDLAAQAIRSVHPYEEVVIDAYPMTLV